MEILSGQQMRRVDRRAIEERGIPGLDLMEAAGRGVADALTEDYPELASRGVVILCGKGNNGGDGLVVARYLSGRGVAARVLLLARGADLQGDAATNLTAARDAGLQVEEIPDEAAWARVLPVLEGRPVVVDAILGTGVRGGARGLAARVIEDLGRSGCAVASVDLPSGVDGDSQTLGGVAVQAERTYTLCRPKLALILGQAARLAGTWRVIPIGIPDEAVLAEAPDLEWLDAAAVGPLAPRRDADSHKGTYGHLLVVAGSRGKSGAAVLAARGALRSGVGLVTVAAPLGAAPSIAAQQAEVMTEGLAETADGSLALAGAAAALELAAGRDALALGPGLGNGPETAEAILEILSDCELPLVVDADGLNALAASDEPPGPVLGAARRPVVLTPHPGEAARLLSTTAARVQADRLAAARELARVCRAVVVLKGHRSLVAAPDGRVAVNSSGNPGMATAGMGDVLTGVVGALLAQGLDGWDASRLAVFVHGDAGNRAAREIGPAGLIASDVAARLPAALAALDAAAVGR